MPEHGHVFPWWMSWHLDNPLRRWLQKPEEMLKPFVHAGMVCLDVGCGTGFFTRPLARLVGPEGRVMAVDLQQRMLDSLRRKADREGLGGRIETLLCQPADLMLNGRAGRFDFALAYGVAHEVPDPAGFFGQVARALRPGGTFYLGEPGHVTAEDFEQTLKTAKAAGFHLVGQHKIKRGQVAVFETAADHEA